MSRTRDLGKVISGNVSMPTMTVDSDFTVDTNTLHVDAINNRVGIGTTSPQKALNIVENSSSTTIGGSTAVVQVGNSNGGALNLTAGVELFGSGAPVSGLGNRSSGIYGVYEAYNAAGNAGALVLATNPAGTTSVAERMRITSAGNVGIGTSSPTATLQVKGNTSQYSPAIAVRVQGNQYEFGHGNTAGYGSVIGAEIGSGAPFIAFNSGAGTNNNTYRTFGIAGSVISTNNAGALTFSSVTNSNADNQTTTERMRINASGHVTTPYQPIAIADNSSGPFSAGLINGGGSSVNRDSMYNSTTGRFTVPVSGYYIVGTNTFGDGSNTFEISIRKNGATYTNLFQKNWVGGSFEGLHGAVPIYLAAGDYVEFWNNKGQIRSSNTDFRYIYLLG